MFAGSVLVCRAVAALSILFPRQSCEMRCAYLLIRGGASIEKDSAHEKRSLTSFAGRGSALHPPIQHQNEWSKPILDKKILGNPACPFSDGPPRTLAKRLSNHSGEYVLSFLMKDGSPLGSQPELSSPAVPFVMLEDRQTEPKHSFIDGVGGFRMG